MGQLRIDSIQVQVRQSFLYERHVDAPLTAELQFTAHYPGPPCNTQKRLRNTQNAQCNTRKVFAQYPEESSGQLNSSPTHSQMKQRISKLSEKERQWVAAQIDGAAKFVEALSESDAGQPLSLAALDRAFAAWLGTQETDNQVVNGAINCVGIAFGQFLVDGAELNWVIATDQNGSDLAIHGLPGNGDVLVYPANFVAKRWERRETNFLQASYQQIVDQVQNVKLANATGAVQKPWWKFW